MGSERSRASRKSLEGRRRKGRGARWRLDFWELEVFLQLKLSSWKLFAALRVSLGFDCGCVTAFPDWNLKFRVRNLRIWVWETCVSLRLSELSGRSSYRFESLTG